MIYASLEAFLVDGKSALAKGPVALIFLEDEVEIASTLRHAQARGFRSIITFAAPRLTLPEGFADVIHHVHIDVSNQTYVSDTVNAVIEQAPGVWFYYGFNAEYLFYPFSETRTIGEAMHFVTEERRDSILTFVIDAYASDLSTAPAAVSLENAMIDKAGYYALARQDPATGHARDRQLNFHGGLRWRFEEHIPPEKRRIDRVSIFRAKPGLRLNPDHTFNEQEYNTYECPWHHSLTAALISFRTAKALKRNPGSTFAVKNFYWPNSERLQWTSQQLLDLGLMEPGQWF